MQTIVIEAIGKKKAKSALTAMAIPSVIAPILGPVIAGALLRFADWRMIFWLHVPICAVAIYLGWRNIPKDSRENVIAGFDIIGFLLLCPGMILSIYGIESINPSSPADMNTGITVASVGIVFLASFFLISKRKPDSSLIDISMFKHSNFRKASLLLFTSSAVYYGGIMLYPLYFIQHDGYPSYLAGILLGIHGIGTLLSRWKLDRISRAVGEERTTFLAVILTIMGSCIVGWHGEIGNTWVLGFGMLLRGAGIGVLTIISMAGAYVGLTDRQISHASSVTRMMTHLGATIGVTGVTIAIKVSSDGYLFSGSVFDGGHFFLLALSTLCFFMINRQKK
jgi:drug resistance transporter, emrB/qacA subfamily